MPTFHCLAPRTGPGYVAGVAHGEAREVEADLPGDGAQPRPGSGLEILVGLVEGAAFVVIVVTVGGVLAVVAVAEAAPASVGEGTSRESKTLGTSTVGDK